MVKDIELVSVVGIYFIFFEGLFYCFFCVWFYFVDLSDNSIYNFFFKGSENNGFVFYWIKDKVSVWLDYISIDIVDGGDSNYKVIFVRRMRKRKVLCVKSF